MPPLAEGSPLTPASGLPWPPFFEDPLPLCLGPCALHSSLIPHLVHICPTCASFQLPVLTDTSGPTEPALLAFRWWPHPMSDGPFNFLGLAPSPTCKKADSWAPFPDSDFVGLDGAPEALFKQATHTHSYTHTVPKDGSPDRTHQDTGSQGLRSSPATTSLVSLGRRLRDPHLIRCGL